jgi:KipI family sensor histidine kinase inhibitor
MRIEPLGDSALLVRVVEEFHPDESLEALLRATEALEAAGIPGVVELVPAYTTIGVFCDLTENSLEAVQKKTEDVLRAVSQRERPRARANEIEVPVCYESEFAPDLDLVAQHTGLSAEEVIARHSGAGYRVSCVGFTPGFPYLSGLPAELATPRRASPRKEIPAGAVAIGGTQTGIYPRKSPGGWNIIGRTPLRLFDVERDPPALFHAGDWVRFRRISRGEFEEMSR